MKTKTTSRLFTALLALVAFAFLSTLQAQSARVASVSWIPLITNMPAPRLINTHLEPLAAVDSLGQVVWASSSSSGPGMYYLQSTDAGQTWTVPVGSITPMASPVLRNISILLVPDANANPLQTQMQFIGDVVNDSSFVFGEATLNNNPASSGTGNYPLNAVHVVSSGIARSVGGKHFSVALQYGTPSFTPDSLVLLANNPASAAPIMPWDPVLRWDVPDSIPLIQPKIAFAPNGMDGWVVGLSNVPGTGPDSNLTPMVWHTADAGLTWTGPQEIDFTNWQCLRDSLQTGSLPVLPTTGFEFDLTVDENGNPHILTAVFNRPAGQSFTLLPGARKWVVDFTSPDQGNTWRGLLVSPLNTFRGEASNLTETYTWDHSFQIGRNPAGNRIFYLWSDTDTTGYFDPNWTQNIAPDLYTAGFSLLDSGAAAANNWTYTDITLSGKATFPHLAPEVLSDTVGQDTHLLPVSIAFITSTGSPIMGDRLYLPGIRIPEAAFTGTFLLVGDGICGSPCANAACVWPGDAQYDYLVDMDDLLMLGVNFDSTGPLRPNASLAWTSQPGNLWPDSTAGINLMHSDCDGNGHVFWADTLAILQNYSLTHSKTGGPQGSQAVTGAPTLSLVPLFDSLQVGQAGTVEIRLGDSLNPADSLYGLRFAFHYDPALVDTGSVHVSFPNSWFGSPGVDQIGLYRDHYFQGRTDIGLVGTDQTDRQGFGTIARVSIVAIDNISGKRLFKSDTLALGISAVRAISIGLQDRPLGTQEASAIVWDAETNLPPPVETQQFLRRWPVPVRDFLHLEWPGNAPAAIAVRDLCGRTLLQQQVTHGTSARIDLSQLPGGTYLVEVRQAHWQGHTKILVQH